MKKYLGFCVCFLAITIITSCLKEPECYIVTWCMSNNSGYDISFSYQVNGMERIFYIRNGDTKEILSTDYPLTCDLQFHFGDTLFFVYGDNESFYHTLIQLADGGYVFSPDYNNFFDTASWEKIDNNKLLYKLNEIPSKEVAVTL